MKTMQDFARAVIAGQRSVVTFKQGIEAKECYPEAGMRARAIRATLRADGLLHVTFGYGEFDEFNKQFETADYYGNGRANLTAREAGYYKPEEEIYFDAEELVGALMSLDEGAHELYAEYTAAGVEATYVQWLEAELRKARGGA